MSMSNSFSNAMTSSTVSRLSAPRSSMKLASGVSLSRSTPSSSTMMSLTFSSSCFMSIAMMTLSGGRGGGGSRSHHHPAVDHQHLSRNVAGQVGGEKEDGAGDVRGLAQPSQRDVVEEVLLRLRGDPARQLGIDIAGGDGVDQHVARRQILSHRLGEADQSGLRRRVIG